MYVSNGVNNSLKRLKTAYKHQIISSSVDFHRKTLKDNLVHSKSSKITKKTGISGIYASITVNNLLKRLKIDYKHQILGSTIHFLRKKVKKSTSIY